MLSRWMPALLLMAAIFVLSSFPSRELPDFGSWDSFFKKGGHMLGYGLLALACRRGLGGFPAGSRLAWGLAIFYAITDEFHQSFVPGRHPSPVDVLVFDNLGAALALVFWNRYGENIRKRFPSLSTL